MNDLDNISVLHSAQNVHFSINALCVFKYVEYIVHSLDRDSLPS